MQSLCIHTYNYSANTKQTEHTKRACPKKVNYDIMTRLIIAIGKLS